MSGCGAVWVGSQCSLCRAPAPSVSCSSALCVGPELCIGALCRAPALSASGPNAPRCSLCRVSTFSESGRGALSLSVSGPTAVRVGSGPGTLCVGARRSLCQGPVLQQPAPNTSLGCNCTRRSLCGGSLRWAPALSVSGPGALRVGQALRSPTLSRCFSLVSGTRHPVGLRSSAPRAPTSVPPIWLRTSSSDPRAAHPVSRPPAQIRAPVRGPPHPQAPSSDLRATHLLCRPPAPIRVPLELELGISLMQWSPEDS